MLLHSINFALDSNRKIFPLGNFETLAISSISSIIGLPVSEEKCNVFFSFLLDTRLESQWRTLISFERLYRVALRGYMHSSNGCRAREIKEFFW